MSGSIAEMIERTRQAAAPLVELEEAPEELPCYAKLRGPRQVAFMVEFRTEAGDAEAFDYGLLGRASFDRSAGITLRFGNGSVLVAGRHLRPLFEAVVAHRVTWVAVAGDAGRAARDPDATVVTAITVEADPG